VIKVTNIANNLVEDVLQHLPGHKILYLYSDLESFLVSNLKKAPETQKKMPALAAAFLADGNFCETLPAVQQRKTPAFFTGLRIDLAAQSLQFPGQYQSGRPGEHENAGDE